MIRTSYGAVYTRKKKYATPSRWQHCRASVETFCPEDAFSLLVLIHGERGERGGKRDIPRAWERKVLWLQAVCRIRRFCRRRDVLVWQGVRRGFRERFAASVPRELIGVWGEF